MFRVMSLKGVRTRSTPNETALEICQKMIGFYFISVLFFWKENLWIKRFFTNCTICILYRNTVNTKHYAFAISS